MSSYEIYSNPRIIYKKMINDIKFAKKSIYLETYIYSNDKIGREFRDNLIRKAKQGVKVFVLIDAWGSEVDKTYFKELTESKGEVRFFRDIRYVIRAFSKNHERNHRKLLIIDNKISYVGSINTTSSCLNWRELVLRLNGSITQYFTSSFLHQWNLYGKLSKKKIKSIIHKGFEIIEDIPLGSHKLTENKYLKLIKNSKKEILIETPYFIPSLRIRRALYKAVKRKVKVKIILPYISDVKIADIVRNRYLGALYKHGIEIYYYLPKILHSKLLIVDSKFFLLGSSNLDYRSFVHQYEINLFGKNKEIANSLKTFFNNGLKNSKQFDYNFWKNRSSLKKILEIFIDYFREYL